MTPLEFIANLAIRWHHLHKLKIWPPEGTTCISTTNSSKCCHQLAAIAFVDKLTTRRHLLYCLQIWPPNGATWISSKFYHHLAPFELTANLVTRRRRLQQSHAVSLSLPHCLELPNWHYQLVLSWYLHQPESHQLSFTKVLESVKRQVDPQIGPQGHLGPIKA